MREEVSILIQHEPYIAYLIQRCVHRFTDKVPTAGVRIMPGGVIELLINPEFFYLQTRAERVGLLWHEMYHLISDHISRSYGLDHHAANVAMDEAINQAINQKFLPKKAILPEYFRHEKHQSFEIYYNLHLKRGDSAKYQQPKPYEGGMDDEKNKKELQEKVKTALEHQKDLQDKQEELQDKQEAKSGQSDQKDQDKNQSAKQKQKDLSKKEDQLDDNQEGLTEKMERNGMDEQAKQSEDLSERQKDLRKRMEKMEKDFDKNGSPDDADSDQKEQAEMQAQQEQLQKEIEEAMDKLDEMRKEQQKRDQQKQQGQGQPGQGSGQGQPGEGQGEGSGGGGEGDEDSPEVMDNHDMWHTSPAERSEQRASLSHALSQAMHDTERNHGSGSVPTQIKEMIAKVTTKPKVNWKTAFRQYVGRNLTETQEYTRRKESRKFGLLAPGKKNKLGPKIIVALDCSGSVREEEYLEALGEVVAMSKHFKDKVEVVFFDTSIFEKKALIDTSTKKLPARPLSGGTDFQCVIDYANENHPDLLIVITDGAAPTPTRPRYPVLWAIVGGRDNPDLFGKRVMVELQNNKANNKVLGEK